LIDYFAIGLTHGLLALAVWRLLLRDDLDHEGEGGTRLGKPRLRAGDGTAGDAGND
jgi:hypothetical protein